MRLSNLADYAVVTMSHAARHCGGGRTSAAELAAETGLIGLVGLVWLAAAGLRFAWVSLRRADPPAGSKNGSSSKSNW